MFKINCYAGFFKCILEVNCDSLKKFWKIRKNITILKFEDFNSTSNSFITEHILYLISKLKSKISESPLCDSSTFSVIWHLGNNFIELLYVETKKDTLKFQIKYNNTKMNNIKIFLICWLSCLLFLTILQLNRYLIYYWFIIFFTLIYKWFIKQNSFSSFVRLVLAFKLIIF